MRLKASLKRQREHRKDSLSLGLERLSVALSLPPFHTGGEGVHFEVGVKQELPSVGW